MLVNYLMGQMKHPEDLVILLNDLDKYKEEGINSDMGKEWLAAIDKAIKNDYPLDVDKFGRNS